MKTRRTKLLRKTAIRKVSRKREMELKVYRVLREEYLREHPCCEFPGCATRAQDIHHKKGRGKWLNVSDHFMGLCRHHHRWIHDHPSQARGLGYLQ